MSQAKICAEKKRLSNKLLETISALTTLQSNHGAYLIAGGDGLPGVKRAIESARKQWEKAKTAYSAHLLEHGC